MVAQKNLQFLKKPINEGEAIEIAEAFGGGGDVDGVTGNIVNNTDPANPVVTQQQADWNVTDNTSPAYIKNKPTVDGNDYVAEYTITTNTTLTEWRVIIVNEGNNSLTLSDIADNFSRKVAIYNRSGTLTVYDSDSNEITIFQSAGQTAVIVAGENEPFVFSRDLFPDGETIIINGDGRLEVDALKKYEDDFVAGDFIAGTLSIPASTHGLGATKSLLVLVYENDINISNGLNISVSDIGNIEISVNSGLEFDGKYIIIKT